MKHNPLSDEEILDILRGEGIHIARRTIAKYRDMLSIPAYIFVHLNSAGAPVLQGGEECRKFYMYMDRYYLCNDANPQS